MKGVIKGEGSKQTYWIDGKEVVEATFREHFPDRPTTGARDLLISTSWKRPILSEALACHTSQVDEIEARNAKHGVHIQYERSTGRPILRNRKERAALLKIEGLHDRDGGYSDGHNR